MKENIKRVKEEIMEEKKKKYKSYPVALPLLAETKSSFRLYCVPITQVTPFSHVCARLHTCVHTQSWRSL